MSLALHTSKHQLPRGSESDCEKDSVYYLIFSTLIVQLPTLETDILSMNTLRVKQLSSAELTIKTAEFNAIDSLVASELGHLLSTDNRTEVPIVQCENQSTKPKTRAEKETIRKRKYHQRIKNERESLRELVGELTSQLQKLQQHKDQDNINAEKVLVSTNWRHIALNQRLQRQTVEIEQMQLFASAKLQAMYIDKLCRQLPGKPMSRLMLKLSSYAETNCTSNPLFDNNKYHAQIESVKTCYGQLDEILSEFDLVNNRNGVTSSICYRKEDRAIEYFQHLNRFTEPYNYEKTHETMWKLAKLLHRQHDRQEFEVLGSQDDTVVLQFRLVRTLASGVAVSVLQRYVSRRFIETNRTVFVWKTLSVGEGLFTGMHAEETGWVCLQPSEEDSTFMRICVRQVPMQFDQLNLSDASISEFHQVLQSSVGEDMVEISTALDKMLLDDTLEGIDI